MNNRIYTWRVIRHFVYQHTNGRKYKPGELFQATAEEVRTQSHKVLQERPDKPKVEEPKPEPKKRVRKRGAPPKLTTNIAAPPLDRSIK